MVGFELYNTISEIGSVSRGVCEVKDGLLTKVTEYTKIHKVNGDAIHINGGNERVVFPKDTIVSLNTWGFTTSIFNELENRFADFYKNSKDILTSEYFLPTVVDGLVGEDKATVTVLKSADRWYGITYKEDKDTLVGAVKNMISNGLYKENLWG